MRTKLFKSIAAVALVAIAASCAKEQTSVPLGGETEVSFSIASPVINTKAIADGNTVDKVVCNVFDSAGKLVEGTEDHKISKAIDMTNGTAKFSVRLVTGQTYSFIFWAYKDSESSPYTLSEDGKTVTVSYENAVSNDESRDAFYAYVAPVQIKGSLSQSVELKRPFAQLNFGVVKDDIKAAEAAEIEVYKSKVTLTGLGNTLNLVDGSVKAIVEGAEVSDGITAEFALATCPMSLESSETLTVDSDEYGYVAMNYVLVGKDSKSLTDATLWIADAAGTLIKEDGLAVSNVPLQGNYRTNVLGNLFTSEVITTVNVAPAFVEDIVKEFVSITAEKIEEANTLIEANKAADIIEVKFAAAPEDNSSQAILTTPVKEDGTLNVEVSSSVTGTLYVGDYKDAEYSDSQALEDADSANKATVNITIPDGVTIEKLVIKAGSKTVTINGVNASEYSDSNKIGTLEATTSMNTLVIAKGQIIDNLIFHKGGLEIHGTVNAITFDDNATTETVEVRDCEGLSKEVYKALEKFIAEDYVGVEGLTIEGKYDIVYVKGLNYEAYKKIIAYLQEGYYGVKNEDGTWDIAYDACPYLTFSADSKQRFNIQFMGTMRSALVDKLEYSVGGSEWTTLVHNDKVEYGGEYGDIRLRGKSSIGTANSTSNYTLISTNIYYTNVPVTASGDIRTLIDWENYSTASTKEAKFCYLFYGGCKGMISAPKLPATELAEYCYYAMFKKCTSLTAAPELPAETLTNRCYWQMFNGCSSLTSVTIKAKSAEEHFWGGVYVALNEWLSGTAASGTLYAPAKTISCGTETVDLSTDSNYLPSGWNISVEE